MGLVDSIKDAITPGFVKKVNTALTPAPPMGVAGDETPAAKPPVQAAYEAKTAAMNAQNPYYKPGDAVPRAKGGPVKKGGAKRPKMKNVDNSGLKKEPC